MNERIDLSAINKQFNCSITVTLGTSKTGVRFSKEFESLTNSLVSHIGTQKLTAIYI